MLAAERDQRPSTLHPSQTSHYPHDVSPSYTSPRKRRRGSDPTPHGAVPQLENSDRRSSGPSTVALPHFPAGEGLMRSVTVWHPHSHVPSPIEYVGEQLDWSIDSAGHLIVEKVDFPNGRGTVVCASGSWTHFAVLVT